MKKQYPKIGIAVTVLFLMILSAGCTSLKINPVYRYADFQGDKEVSAIVAAVQRIDASNIPAYDVESSTEAANCIAQLLDVYERQFDFKVNLPRNRNDEYRIKVLNLFYQLQQMKPERIKLTNTLKWYLRNVHSDYEVIRSISVAGGKD
ncbi:MAG: hypothetical protein HQ557_19275 [Bacteroidetes bacterium]|nr:hypothetical protein [Bacteroidota bacterium]